MPGSHRLRVLFLASYFPKPDNPLMGTWALSQAQALVRQDVDLLVVSCTSWVPRFVALTAGAQAYSYCPKEFIWPGSVKTLYPRWLYYPVRPMKTWAYKNPEPYLKIAWASVKRELCHTIAKFQPDLIFCHHLLPNGWIAAQIPEDLQRPIISADHDFDEITDCRQFHRRRAALTTAIEGCQSSLAVSKRMAGDLQGLFPENSVHTFHHGVDLPPANVLACPRPQELQNKKIILSCALFSERKGIPLLVEAFGQIAERHPDAILRIIGGGPEGNNVIEAIRCYDPTHQVQLLGKKLHEEVLQEMAWADCFALVSWDEPLGQVYLEAMAAGKPVICCQDAGVNDVLRHGVHGYTVPPKDVAAAAKALDQLLGQDSKRLEMGKNARQLVQQDLTWDARATELVKFFDETLGSYPQAPTSSERG
jgi:glycosyltransferase involved in cell wall biosynthesis